MEFKQIKKSLQDKGLAARSCREVGPYKFLENGAKARLRGAGDVARAPQTGFAPLTPQALLFHFPRM